jgi:hypothetical protein
MSSNATETQTIEKTDDFTVAQISDSKDVQEDYFPASKKMNG